MATDPLVRVDGLKELTVALSKLAEYEPQIVKAELASAMQLAVPLVIEEMKSQFVSPPSKLDGTLEDSVRGAAGITKRKGMSASIKIGGAKAPYAGWWNYGGPTPGKYKPGRPPLRDFVKEGRAFYQAVAAQKAAMLQSVQNSIVAMAQKLGLDAHRD